MRDVVIIGGSAGGLTTALYTSRANLDTLVIEKALYGGQMQKTSDIENYPGFEHILGRDLSKNMYDQAIKFGSEFKYGEVINVEMILHNASLKILGYKVHLRGGEVIETKSVVIATGVSPRSLGIKGEQELVGAGVSYCAICDGAFFQDQHVVVIGGGDSALEEANFLKQFASKITLIHRRRKFRGQHVLEERVRRNPKIEIILDAEITKVIGEDMVEGVVARDVTHGHTATINCDGVFIYIGLDPISQPFKELGVVGSNGYIRTNENMQTLLPGVFAVGDIRHKRVRQIATAVGDGAIAGVEVRHFLENLEG